MSDPTDPSVPASPTGDHPHDDLAVYALDALDGTARQAVDAHLTTCVACRAELAEHQEALAGLTPDAPPPPSVWQRIAADVAAPSPTALDTGSAGGRLPRPAHAATRTRRGRARSRWVGAGAALLGAAAAVAAFGLVTRGSDDGADDLTELAQRAEETGDVLGDLTDPDDRPVARVVSDDGTSFVMLEGLEPLPAGRTYQLWSLDGPQPVSLALLGDGRTDVLAVPLPATVSAVAISDEPDTGVVAPTGPIVATGSLTRS